MTEPSDPRGVRQSAETTGPDACPLEEHLRFYDAKGAYCGACKARLEVRTECVSSLVVGWWDVEGEYCQENYGSTIDLADLFSRLASEGNTDIQAWKHTTTMTKERVR